LNDSDKSFTVPAGKVWYPICLYVKLVCSATVGNRGLRFIVTDGTNTIFISPNQTLAASATGYSTFSFTGITDDVAWSGVSDVNAGVPPFVLPAGYVIRVYDENAVDAAADDLTVAFNYVEYEA